MVLLRVAGLVPILLAIGSSLLFGQQSDPSTLTSIKQLHHLPLSIAAKHPSVVVEGVVTGLTFMPHGFTLQDGTEGIYAVFKSTPIALRLGQKLRIWGTGDPGAFAPVLLVDRIEVIGYSGLPRARRIRSVELDGGVLDNQYVEVRGVVRAITMTSEGEDTFGIMKLNMQPGSVLLFVRHFGDNPGKYVDSVVRARGVAEVEFNQRRQSFGLRVRIANIGDITIERAAPADPFSQPVTPIGDIMLFETRRDWSHRLRLWGAVTLQRSGESVVVQDGDRAIRVDTRTDEKLPEGTLLDVAGFVSAEAYSPTLKDAVIRRQATTMIVKPLPQHAVDLMKGRSDWSLVTTAGTLIESGQNSIGLTLLIEDHGTKFSAELRSGRPEQFKVASGSRIQITGVCQMLSNAVGASEGFRLLLRSASDVKILKNAPLLMNREFLFRIGVSFGALTILIALWALTLRHRVHRQTRWIRASLIKEKAAATHDSLTGIANRRHFEESLAAALRKARIDGGEVALFYIDLEGFKRINDTIGHAAGDSLLRLVAQRLSAALDSTQLLSRVGGDEFTVIQPMAAGKRSAEEFAKHILDSFGGAFVIRGNSIQVGASIGISRYPMDGDTEEELLYNADAAMYHAKWNGRGFYFFDSDMREVIRRKLEIRKQLPGAVERGEFFAQFQPIEELSTGSMVRFEALCRWNNPQLGSVPPSEFITIAEETGQINAIGEWMLQESCLQARRWQVDERCPVRLAVNVSAIQFAGEHFIERVSAILAATGFPARLLELELTESVIVSEPEESIRKMHLLRGMNMSLAIDDFGTGYSSLSYLQNMPVDALKIDRSFTAKLESSPTAVTMIRSVIAMGRTLGLRVVTEGVESACQLEILRQLGSDEVQGFYIGRPNSAEMALQLVVATGEQKL